MTQNMPPTMGCGIMTKTAPNLVKSPTISMSIAAHWITRRLPICTHSQQVHYVHRIRNRHYKHTLSNPFPTTRITFLKKTLCLLKPQLARLKIKDFYIYDLYNVSVSNPDSALLNEKMVSG